MKHILISIIFLLIVLQALKAQDTLYIESHIVIEMDDTMIIPKNTVVLFRGNYQLSVIGTLKAIGTEEEPIIFTTIFNPLLPNATSWQGISFANTDENPLSDSSIFEYCSFQHGHAYLGCGATSGYGGAINAWASSRVRFSHCNFNKNFAQKYGGAVYLEKSNIIFEDCVFNENRTDSIETTSGGCMAIINAAPTLNRCKIASSWSSSVGGGIFVMNCDSMKIINCEFIGNSGSTGGAMFISDCSYMIFSNNLFHHNIGRYFGGAFALKNSSFRMINCNIVNNFGGQGGGVYCSSGVTSNAYNCIFQDNAIMENWNGTQIYIAYEESTINFFNCVVANGYNDFGGNGGGVGFHGIWTNVFEEEIHFEQCEGFNYCLPENSPCINAGSMKIVKDLPDFDINYHPRLVGEIVDIGAFESNYGANIQENSNEKNISIYPNPAKESIILNIENQSFIGETFTIYTIEGKVVKSFILNDKTMYISINFLENGFYLLSGKSFNKKLIVRK